MTTFVFMMILLGAACNAGWNAFAKVGLDTFTSTFVVMMGAAVISLATFPFFPLPNPESWPYIAISACLTVVFVFALSEAYRIGDMGQIYPITRGVAPLLTALLSAFWLGERIALAAWIGIVVLVCGVMLMSMRGGRDLVRIDGRAVGFALLTGTMITANTMVDGVGGRLSGHAFAYSLWLYIVASGLLLMAAIARRGVTMLAGLGAYWRIGAGGGTLAVLSYGIFVWAMTQAPIALAAAVREVSILFGSLIATAILREPWRATRIVAAMLIVAGLVVLRLS